MQRRIPMLGAWLCAALTVAAIAFGLAAEQTGAQAPAPGEAAYVDWLLAHVARQQASVQAAPTTLDLGNPAWRREQALVVDTWGQLVQEARDQRPPPALAQLHAQLLQALDPVERARRLLLVAVATGQDPGGELGVQLRAAGDALDGVAESARARVENRPAAREQGQGTRGNLRVSVLGLQRPYVDRGMPADPSWEYVLVRLRLDNVGGEPIRYDALQFRLRSSDDTVHPPTPLQVPDELQVGALEGNRLASQIVGTVAYAVRKGVPSVALLYERQPGEAPLVLPVGDLLPPGTPTAADATPRPAGATPSMTATPVSRTPTGAATPAAASATPAATPTLSTTPTPAAET